MMSLGTLKCGTGFQEHCLRVMSFVIPFVFYEITNAECVYSSNTIIFIGRT